MWALTGAALLGWSLGANDAANAFGPAVGTRMVRHATAMALLAVCVILGAVLEGQRGMLTLGNLSPQDLTTAAVATLSAAAAMTWMTALGLPVSASQAVVGSILGVAFAADLPIDTGALVRVGLCWVGTPVGAAAVAVLLSILLRGAIRAMTPDLLQYDAALRGGLILAGCYSAYALGANNVANVTGVLVGPVLSPTAATWFGGGCIALGAVTFGRRVMRTVGGGLLPLNALSAFVCVLAVAITIHAYAWAGVPVSSSQAVVGAVLGIGLRNGLRTVQTRVLGRVLVGWLLTPLLASLTAAGAWLLFVAR